MKDDLDFPAAVKPGVVLPVATVAAAAGALAGALEGLGIALSSQILLGGGGAALLVVATMGLDAVLGFGAGLVGGGLARLLAPRKEHWRRLRLGTTLAIALLAAYFFLPLTRELWTVQERPGPALGMIALASLITGTFWFNAGYWYRRASIGAGAVVGFRVYAPLVGLLIAGAAGLSGGEPAGPVSTPASAAVRAALGSVPNLVLITVDTLRRDYVGTYGGFARTPILDGLAREGLVFDGAITPVPETAPSHASMFTGLHPARHRVIANGIPLRRGHQTLAEQLEAYGYRTGAFVSSFAAGSSTGFAQGFQAYDDDFLPLVRGLGQVRLARLALPFLLRFGAPARFPWLLERAAPDTAARALEWVDRGTGPMFLWVHLFEPHSPYETHDGTTAGVDHRTILGQEPGYAYTNAEEASLRDLYRQEVEYTDTQIGALIDALKSRGVLDGALVLVVGDHGESLGEHDIRFNHHGIYDEVIRVPLLMWTPTGAGADPAVASPVAPHWAPGTRIPRQVSVGDVANSLLEFAGLPLLGGTESVPLATLARGVDVPSSPVRLLGRMGMSLREGQVYGVRDPDGLKFIQQSDATELYMLTTDPGEIVDIAAENEAAVQSGRAAVEALKRVLAGGGAGASGAGAGAEADTRAMLEALGYSQ